MADEGIKLGDFINPNSMITPGAAGGITMAITNVLTSQFDGLPGNWTALILSFLFGSRNHGEGRILRHQQSDHFRRRVRIEWHRSCRVQQVDDDVKKDKGYFKDWSWGK